jgi:hypothetical protein
VLDTVQLILLSVIFGGMVTFKILFAPLVFIKLGINSARHFISAFFPFDYLYFSFLSFAFLIFSLLSGEHIEAIIGGISLLGFIISRQVLMPMANAASDDGQKSKFDIVHKTTVSINTLQLVAFLLPY